MALTAASALAASASLCFFRRFSLARLPFRCFASRLPLLGRLSFGSLPGCLFLRGLCRWFLAGRFGAAATPSTALRRRSSWRGGLGSRFGHAGHFSFFFSLFLLVIFF